MKSFGAGHFSMVLGLSGMGYALLNAARLWGIGRQWGDGVLLIAALVWLALLVTYAITCLRHRHHVLADLNDPAMGAMSALLGIATLVLVPAVAPYSFGAACALAAAGIAWHLGLSMRHAASLWRGGRQPGDISPALYLPDVAGNFTSAAALGVLGQADWAWLFLGAGVFSWLTLEPVIKMGVWHAPVHAPQRRPLMGIQAAPAVVCAASVLLIDPQMTGPAVAMLLGYGLFQLLHGLRLLPWLRAQRFARSYWAYTFGMTSALNCCLKLALAGNGAARALALPLMAAVSAFIGYLCVRTLRLALQPQAPAQA